VIRGEKQMCHSLDVALDMTEWILPSRAGPRPAVSAVLPHIQLDHWPPPSVFGRLVARCSSLPRVKFRESRMASPEIQALCLPEELAHGPKEAFIDDHEFCHLHPLPQCSIHLTLPSPMRQMVIECGWGEPHRLVLSGIVAETLMMLYAPRDDQELEVVAELVAVSYRFAAGSL
jgi:hypothetical protein